MYSIEILLESSASNSNFVVKFVSKMYNNTTKYIKSFFGLKEMNIWERIVKTLLKITKNSSKIFDKLNESLLSNIAILMYGITFLFVFIFKDELRLYAGYKWVKDTSTGKNISAANNYTTGKIKILINKYNEVVSPELYIDEESFAGKVRNVVKLIDKEFMNVAKDLVKYSGNAAFYLYKKATRVNKPMSEDTNELLNSIKELLFFPIDYIINLRGLITKQN